MVPSHYMNQSWIISTEVLWPPPKGNFTERTDTQLINPNWDFEKCTFKIPANSPRSQRINAYWSDTDHTSGCKCVFWFSCLFLAVSLGCLVQKWLKSILLCTVYPIKCTLVLTVSVIFSLLVELSDLFTHIFQGCFTGTGAIIWLPQYQWSNPEGYG